jgi:hypothetical protein
VLYPPGSARQLVALCEQLQIKRSLIDARWVLWWDGFPIEEARIRALFNAKAAQLEFFQEAEEQRKLTDFIDEWARGRQPHAALRSMRQKTGVERFPALIKQLLKFGTGSFDGPANDADAVALGLGLPDSDGLEEQLRTTSPAYDPRRLREVLEASSLQDLEEARDEVRAVFELPAALMAIGEAEIGRRLPRPFEIELKHPSLEGGLYFVLLWLSVRCSPGMREMYENTLSTVRTVAKGVLFPTDALETNAPLETSDQNPEDPPND